MTFNKKGEIMKKSYLAAILGLVCVFGLGVRARAQDEQVVAKVPFDFVAGGKAMPAGTYNVSRIVGPQHGLVIRGDDNSAFVLPVVFDGVASDHAGLGFEHVGDSYFLSKIETLEGVYTVGTPRPMTKVAQMKDNSTMSSSSSGSN
jgi:hypothetical protein